jgi:hypothetical protein
MARKQKDDLAPDTSEMLLTLSGDHKKTLQAIIENERRIKNERETTADDIKALAEKLGIKPADVKGWVNLIIKEEDSGGQIQKMKNTIDIVEQYWGRPAEELHSQKAEFKETDSE